jgi:hypothetical protein
VPGRSQYRVRQAFIGLGTSLTTRELFQYCYPRLNPDHHQIVLQRHECATQRAIVRWLNTAGSGWGLRDYFPK